jgi:O-antigen/teichoic acid export membrane protein
MDQAFFSGIYFIQTAAYVRHLSTFDFGIFSVFYYTLVILISIQRAVIVTPMIISVRSDGRGEIRVWQSGALVLSLSLCCLLLLAFAAQMARHQAASHLSLLYCAFGVTPLLAFEFHRRSLFLQHRPLTAAASSAIFFLLQGAGTAAALYFHASLQIAVGIYIVNSMLAAIVAGLFALRGLPAASEKFAAALKANSAVIGWNLASLAPYTIYNNAMPIIVSMLFGVREAAIYSATRVLVAPLTMLVSAVDSTDKPRAARALEAQGIAGLFKSLRRTALTLGMLAAPYLIILLVFPRQFLTLAVGTTYGGHVELIPYWVALGLLMLIGQPVESGLVVLRRSDLFFWSRTIAAALTLVFLAMQRHGPGALAGLSSTAWGWGISCAISLGLMVYAAKRWRAASSS